MQGYPGHRIFNDPDALAGRVAKEFLTAAEKADALVHVALSGGSTPKKMFSVLTHEYAVVMPWNRVHLWWGDERCVPPDDPESNYGAVRETLLSRITIPAENIHRIRGEEDPAGEAARYAQELQGRLPANQEGVPVFDWILLGMGDDGHTASLFPANLPLDFRSPTLVTVHPGTGQKRISLGAGIICASRKVSFLVTGSSKTQVVREVFQNSSAAENYPAAVIQQHCAAAEWLLDRAAASELS
jgi:6-phosphogluconolactonase